MKIALVVITAILLMITCIQISADDVIIPEGCEVVRCTCYTPTGNKTATGVYPYEGICASNREHLGMVASVYTLDMKFVGYFECRDLGGHKGLQDGTRIDIFRETEEGVREWQNTVGDYCIVQWVKGEG